MLPVAIEDAVHAILCAGNKLMSPANPQDRSIHPDIWPRQFDVDGAKCLVLLCQHTAHASSLLRSLIVHKLFISIPQSNEFAGAAPRPMAIRQTCGDGRISARERPGG